MARQAIRAGSSPDGFTRMHRLFVDHMGCAIAIAWLASGAAAMQAPWLSNIRGLIDPAGPVESTASFLFGLPLLMTLAWAVVASSPDLIRRSQMIRNQAVEFGFAGLVAFAVFCMAIHRVATAVALGS